MLECLELTAFCIVVIILIDKFNNWFEDLWVKKENRK